MSHGWSSWDAELRGSFDTISVQGVPIETTVVNGACAPLPGTKHVDFDVLLATPSVASMDLSASAANDVCTIMYTSGTTGPSKGVLMPQGHCWIFGYSMAKAFALTPEDKMFVCMPFFHAMGLVIQICGAVSWPAPLPT